MEFFITLTQIIFKKKKCNISLKLYIFNTAHHFLGVLLRKSDHIHLKSLSKEIKYFLHIKKKKSNSTKKILERLNSLLLQSHSC